MSRSKHAALLAAAVSILVSCGASNDEASPKPQAPTKVAGKKTETALPEPASSGGVGILAGKVVLTGDIPVIPPFDSSKIPDKEFCAAHVKIEEIVVNSENRGIKNAVVTIHGVEGAVPTKSKILIANKNCNFEPHVAAVGVGSELEVTNEDRVNHTTHAYLGSRNFFDVPIGAKGDPIKRPLRKAGIVRITCDIHKWMTAWLVVHENDLFAVTDENGAFEISGVPAGTYRVKAWHEKLGEIESESTIEPEKTASKDFSLAAPKTDG